MSGFHDTTLPFWKTSMAMSLVYMPAVLAYGMWVVVPIMRGEWSWATHGMFDLFATGLLLLGVALLLWHIQSTPEGTPAIRRCAWVASVLAVLLIVPPAFIAKNSVLSFQPLEHGTGLKSK